MRQFERSFKPHITLRIVSILAIIVLCTACSASDTPSDQAVNPLPATTSIVPQPKDASSPSAIAMTPAAPETAAPSDTAAVTTDIALFLNQETISLVQGTQRIQIAQSRYLSAANPLHCSSGVELTWSPDGHRLATWDGVLTLGSAPSETAQLAPIAGSHFQWSPNGQRLAYIAGVGEDSDLLMVSEVDGLNAQERASGHWSQTGWPAWSPDSGLVTAGPGMYTQLTATTPYTVPQDVGRNAAWSPNGDLLAWTLTDAAGDEGNMRLSVYLWDGAQQSELVVQEFLRQPDFSDNEQWWRAPAWSDPRLFWLPDSSGILIPISHTGLRNSGTYLVRLDSSIERIATDEICDLSPDGRQMLARTAQGKIVAIRVAYGVTIADFGPALTAKWRPTVRGPTPPAPLAAASPTIFLANPRMEGALVREAQQRLADLRYDVGDIDGIFGPQTEAAIRVFQRKSGLEVDVIVGPQTWAALRNPGACPAGEIDELC
ncbi:MAG: peptidoglycan-binding protein [Chloroflexales bacterium]|nr:peptidoglycan-binding protein [Chloroflexales bacterium]